MTAHTHPTSTRRTAHPDADDTIATDDAGQAYQLCEFCRSYQEPCTNPSSVCDCTPVDRSVSGPYEVQGEKQFFSEAVFTVAANAIIEKWAPSWEDITVDALHVPGQCNDEYTVTVTFDGVLCEDLSEPYDTNAGVARVQSFRSDGSIDVGITLHDDE